MNYTKIVILIPFVLIMMLVSNHDNSIHSDNKHLSKEVLGFYPYYLSQDEYKKIPLRLITTIAWKDVTPNSNGTLVMKPGWPPTQLIRYSHEKGVKVVIVVGSNDKYIMDSIFASTGTTLADNLLSIVQTYDMDGINIDFEGINDINSITGTSNKPLLVDFMKVLSSRFWAKNPSYQIIIDLPDKDWSGIWDVAELQNYCTTMMIMGYDIYYKNSPVAGPPSPLDGDYTEDSTIRKDIDSYLSLGVKKDKLLLGVPYYGYIWPTAGPDRKSNTTGSGEYVSYDDMVNLSMKYGRKWDNTWKTPWFAYQVGSQWYQGHYDDRESLELKYDLVLSKKLAGIGIWHLGYARKELWKLIEVEFYEKSKNDV